MFKYTVHNWLTSSESIPPSTPIYNLTIGSLAVSQFRPFTPLYLLSTGSLALSQLSPYLQVLGELLTPLLLDLLSHQFPWLARRSLQSQLTLLEPEYCPTSLPVRIAQGSVSVQLAPVLIWNTQVLYQASGPYRMRVRIHPLDNTVLLWKGQVKLNSVGIPILSPYW